MTYLIGQRLGRYQVQEEIGRGGMARVYRGLDTQLQRTVALKVLAPQLAIDPEFTRRFDREAVTVANLRHPNIVTIYDVGEHEGLRYIAMEFIRGRSLYTIIDERGALGLSYAIALVEPMAAALDYAHSQGAVHRDVKPQNILIDTDGRVLLTDFGIAQGPEQGQERLTRTGLFMGTPEYISPEQASAERVDGRSDLYSLGIATYEIITGQVPFSGATPQLIVAHVQSRPPPPSAVDPEQPPELDAVLARILAKRPDSRFATGAAFAAALRQVARKYGVPVATPADLADLTVPRASATGQSAVRVAPRPVQGSKPAPLYGAAANGGGALNDRTAVGPSPLADAAPRRPLPAPPRRPVEPRGAEPRAVAAGARGINMPWLAIGLVAGALLLVVLLVIFRNSGGTPPNPFEPTAAPTLAPVVVPLLTTTNAPPTVAPSVPTAALPTEAPTSQPTATEPTRTRATRAPVPTDTPEPPPTDTPEPPPTDAPAPEPTVAPTPEPTATDPPEPTIPEAPTSSSDILPTPVPRDGETPESTPVAVQSTSVPPGATQVSVVNTAATATPTDAAPAATRTPEVTGTPAPTDTPAPTAPATDVPPNATTLPTSTPAPTDAPPTALAPTGTQTTATPVTNS